MLVLFDLVIDNPAHPETNTNLALLDVGSGHFSRLEYASGGVLPGSIMAEFGHVARTYVQERRITETNISTTTNEIPCSLGSVMQTQDTLHPIPLSQMPVPLAMPEDTEIEGWDGNWDFNLANEQLIPGTEMMDLFGSRFIGWDRY
jgi:hypothetical protein